MLLSLLLLVLQDPEAESRALLAEAEEDAREGRYSDARSAYERLAKRFPATEAGRVGERRSKPSAFLGWEKIVDHGPSANRVDVVLMGDGYEFAHLKSFDKLAADIPPLFERVEPFREYWTYFDFVRASLVSAQNGVDGFGRDYDTALGARTADTFAGHVSIDGGRVRAMLDELPEHDGLAICFVKNGVLGTGGSGFAAIGGRDASTTIHEWGHAFGHLGDEYETQQAAHAGSVGSCPNVSPTGDEKLVPWAHWIRAKHPSIGAYEGAAGRVKGAWKPTSSGCVMASEEEFCPVCREALVLRIYSLVDPIDDCAPPAQSGDNDLPYRVEDKGLELHLKTMRPATHTLDVRWWVIASKRTSASGGSQSSGPRLERTAVDRTLRGPLAPIDSKPFHTSLHDPDGEHVLLIRPNDFEPGTYRVVARAADTTELRGEKFPWVLEDERGLLQSERTWWIEIPAR